MPESKLVKIIFLTGKPASGKDTQAKLLVKKEKLDLVVTSEEIRKFLNSYKKNYLKLGKIKINLKKQKELINKGKLVSYRLVAYIISRIIKNKIKEKRSVVFSGSPRSTFEARKYTNMLKNIKDVKFYFIYLKISDKTAIKRALSRKEGRPDDNLKTIKTRLKVFYKEINPMLKWLKRKKLLIEINGEKSPNEVFKEILKAIEK